MNKIRVGINGFGRMGRLALREAWNNDSFEFVHINEVAGDSETAAHLLNFDSVHGRWEYEAVGKKNSIVADNRKISYSRNKKPEDTPWDELGVDLVVECSGKFKKSEKLQGYFDRGVRKIVVSAPVKDGPLNIVMGVNDHLYNDKEHNIVTAASCTTNCLAPVVDVLHKTVGIEHGAITTIHDITNTQSILDGFHKDLRRARACGMSLIPTTTGSATAITKIFPELEGKLNGMAVRVPLANSSLTDCVFEVKKDVTAKEINNLLKEAAEGRLKGILGYEEKPLVSADFLNDRRSSIVDALSTMVVDKRMVKIIAWYDNEIGYVNRMMELAEKVGNGAG